jgi:Ribbon-helix-helix protein, copG family.
MATSKRITSVSLPPELVEQADEIAESRDRTRSYLVAEALRQFCEREGASSGSNETDD